MDDPEIPTYKSLLIEMRFGAETLAVGTALLVAKDKDTPCVLVTNRHNVTGCDQHTGKCLHSQGGIPDRLLVHFHKEDSPGEWVPIEYPLRSVDKEQLWIEHPTLGAAADIVAIHLRDHPGIDLVPYYLTGGLDRIDMLVGPAEAVSVIGFPFGLASSGKYPVWATGFLAQELALVTAEQPTFLIDCRTRQGQSGSAVIAYRPNGYRFLKDGRPVAALSPRKVWEFLGVYSGRVNAESDLGRVWHVSAVEALVDAACR